MSLKIRLLLLFALVAHLNILNSQGKIKGITMVAPPRAFESDPTLPIKELGANYIKLVPYGFTPLGKTIVKFNMDRQWWGEKDIGVKESIRLAHANNIKVMLKPQIYIPGSWVGDLSFDTDQEWEEWENNYRDFIFSYLDIAIEYEVELFCVGTEYKKSVKERPQFWTNLVSEIRDSYCGELTYSANWDNFENISFWNQLDYIGISSYFPLSEEITPDVNKLVKAWKPIVSDLKAYSNEFDRQIIFTEYGYLSVDGCAGKTWELEKNVHSIPINEKAQSNSIEALFTTLWSEDFWAGGFLWKWFPEGMGHEGYPERDYTPQNKLSSSMIKNWFENND